MIRNEITSNKLPDLAYRMSDSVIVRERSADLIFFAPSKVTKLLIQLLSVLNFHRLLTPAFAVGMERNGKPVRQHALVRT